MPSCKSNQGESMQRVKMMTKQAIALAAMGYLALQVGTTSPVLAGGGHGHDNDRCSIRTLKGTYVWTQDGFENRRVNTATTPGLPTYTDPVTGVTSVVTA